jgi:hypothetical protein
MVFFCQLKRAFGIYGEIDRCLVHVDDKMPVTIRAKDDAAHEQHEVESLALDFGRHALQCVSAHSIGKRMSDEKAFHGAAARCVGLCTELGQEKQCPQNNDKRVDDDPLLVQLEDVVQQGVFQQLQLAERTLMGCLPLGLEDLVQRINVANPLCSPLHEAGVADTQFRHGLLQHHTLHHQPLCNSKDAMLPARCIAHTDFPTAATRLDGTRHRGWAWK